MTMTAAMTPIRDGWNETFAIIGWFVDMSGGHHPIAVYVATADGPFLLGACDSEAQAISMVLDRIDEQDAYVAQSDEVDDNPF